LVFRRFATLYHSPLLPVCSSHGLNAMISQVGLHLNATCNYDTLESCPSICLEPRTAFKLQNIPTCFASIEATGTFNTSQDPVPHLYDACMEQYCNSTIREFGGCPFVSFVSYDHQVGLDDSLSICNGVCYTGPELLRRRRNHDIGGIGVSHSRPRGGHSLKAIGPRLILVPRAD
jgi:hypothetical protein